MILTRLLIVFTKKSDDYAIFSLEAFEENLENELQTRELCGILIADKIKKGYDVDKPRNLAKSVTVE